MKTIPAALLTHYAKTVTTLCYCWKFTLKDGRVFGFTNHTDDVFIKADGLLYKAETGFTATAIRNTNILDVDNFDTEGAITSDLITTEELMAGEWHDASIEIFKVNYLAPDDGKDEITQGKIGDINYTKNFFKAEFRSISQLYQRPIGEVTSMTCRARLGDARCKKDLTAFTFTGVVEVVYANNNQIYSAALTQDDDYFAYGYVLFTTGLNAGQKLEIKSNANGVVLLQLPMPYEIAVGDEFTIVAGCDGLLATCRDKFDNIVNMRAEPYVPTNDQVLAGPDRNV